MKKRKLLTVVTALAMAMLLPVTSLAATHENVDTFEKMKDAFEDDTDADVYIVLSGDIVCMSGETLKAKVGQTYTISGKEYELVDMYFGGDGTVDITANLRGEVDDAISTYDNVKVTVNGDVTSDCRGIYAAGQSQVTVNGNVDAELDGFSAYDKSQVTVNGNVDAKYDGVDANDQSQVTVNGNVTGGDDGVDAADQSQVTVNDGNVTGKDDGVDAGGKSQVTVNGDVTGGDDGVNAADQSQVTVNGNVTGGDGQAPDADGNLEYGNMNAPGGYSDGGYGIYAEEDASVTVSGDVTGGDAYGTYGYGGTGIGASDNADVAVGGNVTGGNVTANADVPSNGDKGRGGFGVCMDSTANVTVGGNVTGGNTNAQDGRGGDGACIILALKETEADGDQVLNPPGELTVGGLVIGGTAENGTDGAAIYYEGEEGYGEDIPNCQPPTDGTTEEKLEFLMNDSIYAILYAATTEADLGGDAAIKAVLDYAQELYDLFETATGKDPNALDSPEEALQEIQKLPESEQKELAEQMLAVYDKYMKDLAGDDYLEKYAQMVEELRDGIIAPVVTVYGLESAEGTDTVEGDVSDVLRDLLDSEINYIIHVVANPNGTITVDKETAKAGETVTVTVKANAGYRLVKVLVSGEELKATDGVYSFVMPEDGKVEVSAEFAKIASDSTTKTGDPMQVSLMMLLFAVSGAAAVVAYRRKRAYR